MSKTLAEHITEAFNALPRRVDAAGHPIPFGGGEAKAPAFVHSRGEGPYSLRKVLLAAIENDPTKAVFERDVHKRLEAIGHSASPGGWLVPLSADLIWPIPGREQDAERLQVIVKQAFPRMALDPEELAWLRERHGIAKAMNPLTDTAGGALVPYPSHGELLDYLRAMAVPEAAGARSVVLPPQGSIYYPAQSAGAAGTWLAPNTAIVPSQPGTGGLLMSAKRWGSLVEIPNDLLRYSVGLAEQLVRTDLMEQAALAESLAALEGQGGAAPIGILQYPQSAEDTPTPGMVTRHDAGTIGGTGNTFLARDVMEMVGLQEESNDPMGPTAWAMRPLFFAKLANARADSGFAAGDQAGPFMFPVTRGALGGAVEKQLSGYKVVVSTQVSRTRQKGGNTNLTYTVLGNWRRMFVGRSGAFEVAVSKEAGTAFASDQSWIRIIMRTDIGLTHPEAFVLCDTLLP